MGEGGEEVREGEGGAGFCTSHAIPPCVVVGYDEEFCEMKDNFSRGVSE